MNKFRVKFLSALLLSISLVSPMEGMRRNNLSSKESSRKGFSSSFVVPGRRNLNNNNSGFKKFDELTIQKDRDMTFSFAPSYSSYEVIYDRSKPNLNNNVNLNVATENINTKNLPGYLENRIDYLTSVLNAGFSGRDVNHVFDHLRNNPNLYVRTFLGDDKNPRTSWTNDFRIQLGNQRFQIDCFDDARRIDYRIYALTDNGISAPNTVTLFNVEGRPISRADSNMLEVIRANIALNNRSSKLNDMQHLLAFMQFLCTNHSISWIKENLKQSKGFLALDSNGNIWRAKYDKILIRSDKPNDFYIVFTENVDFGVTIHAYRDSDNSCWNFELVSFS